MLHDLMWIVSVYATARLIQAAIDTGGDPIRRRAASAVAVFAIVAIWLAAWPRMQEALEKAEQRERAEAIEALESDAAFQRWSRKK